MGFRRRHYGGKSKRALRKKASPRRSRGFAYGALAGLAAIGAFLGGAASFKAGHDRDTSRYIAALDLRDAPSTTLPDAVTRHRQLLERGASLSMSPERLSTPFAGSGQDPRSIGPSASSLSPKIILIVDDIGLDARAFERILALPGPVTLSFLPYADGVDRMAEIAAAQGNSIMLHLPMEPLGRADPGPNHLAADMSATELKRSIDWNLSRFRGYSGVNNHMGSRLTRDRKAMRVVLERLAERDLFFLDSLTTGGSVVAEIAGEMEMPVFARDLFLDADPDASSIKRQLAELEAIARKTGYAVAICHPRPETLDVIGPWLTSAKARGFDLATVDYLMDLQRAAPPTFAMAGEQNAGHR